MTTERALPPHQLDTRTKFYIAVIAFLASIVGAGAGAWASIHAAGITSQTQTDIAEYNFLQTQRQRAYSVYIADQIAFVRAQEDVQSFEKLATTVGPEKRDELTKDAHQTADEAYQQLELDQQEIQLIGGAAVSMAATNLYEINRDIQLVFGSLPGSNAPRLNQPYDDLSETLNLLTDQERTARAELQTAMRAELGLS